MTIQDQEMLAKKTAAKIRAPRSGAGTVSTKSTPQTATAVKPVEILSNLPEAPRADPGISAVRPNGVAAPPLSAAQKKAEQDRKNAALAEWDKLHGASVPPPAITSKETSAAGHTYDVGYKKWENFDVEAAVAAAAADDENAGAEHGDLPAFDYSGVNSETETNQTTESTETEPIPAQPALTPATLANLVSNTPVSAASAVPRARGVHHNKDAETAQREAGNKEYQQGQFTAAVKTYTKCLGLKAHNYVAFSNRAMAYLKLKEYIRAEQDCCSALSINSQHTKSLMRRATARNALGKHRGALEDLYTAQEITLADPASTSVQIKQFKGDISRTQELLKQSVSRAPLARIPINWAGEEDVIELGEDGTFEVQQGPDLPR